MWNKYTFICSFVAICIIIIIIIMLVLFNLCLFCLQLAVKCMTEEEVMALYLSRAQELERDGKFKEAER